MPNTDKLACDLVSHNFVDASKVQDLIAFLREYQYHDEFHYMALLASNEEKRSETGVWRCYGALENAPMNVGTLVGKCFWHDGSNDKDWVKVCDFVFDPKGAFIATRLAENHLDVEVAEGLICPDSGLLFLRWNKDPGDHTKVVVDYEYPRS